MRFFLWEMTKKFTTDQAVNKQNEIKIEIEKLNDILPTKLLHSDTAFVIKINFIFA